MTELWPFEPQHFPGYKHRQSPKPSEWTRLGAQQALGLDSSVFGVKAMVRNFYAMASNVNTALCAVWDSSAQYWYRFDTPTSTPTGSQFRNNRRTHSGVQTCNFSAFGSLTVAACATDGNGTIVFGGDAGASASKYGYVRNSGTTFSVGTSSTAANVSVKALYYCPFFRRFFAGLSDGTIETSGDGESWILSLAPDGNSVKAIAGNDHGIVGAIRSQEVQYTTNLVDWNRVFTLGDDALFYVDGRFHLLSNVGGRHISSKDLSFDDLIIHQDIPSEVFGSGNLTVGIAVIGKLILLMNTDGACWASTDTENWELVWQHPGANPAGVVAGDGRFMLVSDASELGFGLPVAPLQNPAFRQNFPFPQTSKTTWSSGEVLSRADANVIVNNTAQAATTERFDDWAVVLSEEYSQSATTTHAPTAGLLLWDPNGRKWYSFEDLGTSADVVTFRGRSEIEDGTITSIGNAINSMATDGAGTILLGLAPGAATAGKYSRATGSTLTFSTQNSTDANNVNVDALIWSDALGLFIAGLSNGVVETSATGATGAWTARTTPNTDARTGIAVNLDGVIVMTSSTNTSVIRSTDGITWTEHSLPGASPARVVWVGGSVQKFVTCDVSAIYASADGQTWSAAGLDTPTNSPTDGLVAFGRLIICNGEVSGDGGATWISLPKMDDEIRVGENQLVTTSGTSDWQIHTAFS